MKENTASGDFVRFIAEVGCDTPEKALPWGDCWQPYSNLMTHQLCATAHPRVPSYDEALLQKCYADDAWALAVAKKRLSTHFVCSQASSPLLVLSAA